MSTNSSFTLLHDGGARQGSYYAKVVVAPSGCGSCTERSEVVHMKDEQNRVIYENENSGTQQYSFSVKFDSTWKPMVGNSGGAWGIFLQLHGDDSLQTNPAWAFSASDRIDFGGRAGDINVNRGQDYTLSNNSLNKGKWIDFILTVKYAKDKTGFYKILRRDEGETNFTEILNVTNVETLQYRNGPVLNHYMKHGLYRNQETFTSILYIDGFTRTAVDGSTIPTPLPPVALSTPMNLRLVSSTATQTKLQWDYVGTDQTGFVINRKRTSSGTYGQFASTTALSYTDSNVSASTQYCYRVQSYTSTELSSNSNEVCLTTPAAPIVQPTPTATPVPTPTQTPRPIPTLTPTPLPTLVPTPIPTLAPTATPVPTLVPKPPIRYKYRPRFGRCH